MTQKFACYDKDGIWGVGETEEQARAEGEGFIRDNLPADEINESLENLKLAPMDDDLCAEILDAEGAAPIDEVPFVLKDGVLVLDVENDGEDDEDEEGEGSTEPAAKEPLA